MRDRIRLPQEGEAARAAEDVIPPEEDIAYEGRR